MFEDAKEMIDFTIKLSGIILKKAEAENNFTSVYSKVFEKIMKMRVFAEEEILTVLGDVGG